MQALAVKVQGSRDRLRTTTALVSESPASTSILKKRNWVSIASTLFTTVRITLAFFCRHAKPLALAPSG